MLEFSVLTDKTAEGFGSLLNEVASMINSNI